MVYRVKSSNSVPFHCHSNFVKISECGEHTHTCLAHAYVYVFHFLCGFGLNPSQKVIIWALHFTTLLQRLSSSTAGKCLFPCWWEMCIMSSNLTNTQNKKKYAPKNLYIPDCEEILIGNDLPNLGYISTCFSSLSFKHEDHYRPYISLNWWFKSLSFFNFIICSYSYKTSLWGFWMIVLLCLAILQEFKEGRRKYQQAPQVLFSHKEPPQELQDTDARTGDNIGYITFGRYNFDFFDKRKSCIMLR